MNKSSPVPTITLADITKQVCAIKPVSRRQVLRYMRTCKIRPAGELRQKPEHYPADSAERILERLGLRIVSMRELRAERRRAASPRRRVNGNGKNRRTLAAGRRA
jgi:hypothetical protein